MVGVVVRLSMAFCMIGGACLSVRADPAVDHQLRAIAHFTRGEFSQAIADSTAALRAEPNYEGALRLRGLAQLYAGRPKAAIGDFAAAVRLSPSDALGVILLHLARVRAQQSDDQEFGANVARVDRREWPGLLVEVLTGEATANQVGDFVMAVPDEKVRLDRVCEARVYLGLLQLSAKDKGEARKLFSAAVSDCPPGAAVAGELAMAKLELRRLGNASGAPTTTSQAEPRPTQADASAVQEPAPPNTVSLWTTDPLTWLMGSQAEPGPRPTPQAEAGPTQARAKKVSAVTNSNVSVNSVRSKASVNSTRSKGSANSASSNASASTVGSTKLVDESNYMKIQSIGLRESDNN
jgi:lipoprotein NlpI